MKKKKGINKNCKDLILSLIQREQSFLPAISISKEEILDLVCTFYYLPVYSLAHYVCLQ